MTQFYSMTELPKESKEELFKGLGSTFDYALPQYWLDSFSAWCKKNKPEITYDLILSTTVWSYADTNSFFGGPLTCCLEVQKALDEYEYDHSQEKNY